MSTVRDTASEESVMAVYVPPQAAEFGVCTCPNAAVTTQRWRLVSERFTNQEGDVSHFDSVLRCELCGAARSGREASA